MNKKSNGKFRMIRPRYWSKTGTRLALGAVLALGLRVCAQDLTTNSMPVRTNTTAPIASVVSKVPFACAIVDHPGVILPEQGPWAVSESDLTSDIFETMRLVGDLVKHSDPRFHFLWNSLSSETKSAIEEEQRTRIDPGLNYKPGPGIKALAANLNVLIYSKLIYDEETFAPLKPYFSGDTVKLLNQPDGADVGRLNRLLLEEALPLDIVAAQKFCSTRPRWIVSL